MYKQRPAPTLLTLMHKERPDTNSVLQFCFVECQIPWFTNGLIRWAIDRYHVNMSEAKREGAEEYRHFNDFFTRSLKEGARPLPEDPEMIVSPADGVISQMGDIKNGRIFQAKGHD